MNWTKFLKDVSRTVIDGGDLLDNFKNEHPGQWLGYPGASDQQIRDAEQRLSVSLPPSYKAFLNATNGFKQLSCFIWDILPAEKIDWLKNFDRDFHDLYASSEYLFNVTDKEYFVYGEEQNQAAFRSDYLVNSIAVSGWGDASIILLNPQVKFGEEWEAWMYASWQPGASRYRSFEELMKTNYSDYLELLNE